MHDERRILGIAGALLAAVLLSSRCPAGASQPPARVAQATGSAAQADASTQAMDASMQATDSAMQETAVRALRWAFYAPNGYRWEYSGILIIRDGQLGYSAFPRTLKKVDAVEMDPNKQRASGDTLVALYHTHPCKPREYFPQYFSPQDLVSAFFWHVPTFILDECTGDVHEFDPTLDRARDTGVAVVIRLKDGRSRHVRLPAGRIVGNIGDRGPDLSLIESLMHRTLY
jgi:proteasome lid subunit RPN8/RPN11